MSARLAFVSLAIGCSNQTPPPSNAPPGAPPPAAAEEARPRAGRTTNGVPARPAKPVAVKVDGCPQGGTIDAAIAVDDRRATVERDPELTAFLVPVAEGAGVRSVEGWSVVDESGARLPAQFEVLSRWGAFAKDCAAPIRFAFARVRATPGAGKRAIWRVKSGAKPEENSPLVLETTEKAWVVDTGVARFTIRRDRFEGLSKVEVPDDRGTYTVVTELRPETGGSSFFVDHGGLLRVSDASTWKLELERSGPQVVTVVARGYYPGKVERARRKGPNERRGLAFTVRLHFHAGSAFVRVDHAYYHGEVADWGATGLTNTTLVNRAWMSIPLVRPPTKIYARADSEIHALDPTTVVQVEQIKRTPQKPDIQYGVFSGDQTIESGGMARRPFMAATGDTYVLATIARMAEREPQGFTWSDQLGALDVDFTSAPIQVGAARGIWSVAALDFGRGVPDEARAQALQLFAERPLAGAPVPEYSNGTRTIGPYGTKDSGVVGAYADLVEKIHANTKSYHRRVRITGLQIWPDMPANSCEINYDCASWEAPNAYFGGGDNNYWNWSKPGIDEFFRTGDHDYLYDFSLAEATTFAETIAVRLDHHHIGESSVAGLAPCYGDAQGYDNRFVEGTNNRRDRCPADYTYGKTLELAFLASGDFRFVDYFEEAGTGVVNIFGEPPEVPQPYLELNFSRLSEQRLELLADGAEFARDPAIGEVLRAKLRKYVDHMIGRTLVEGHACETAGSGQHDVTKAGQCNSVAGWMMPVATKWAVRTSRILKHEGLRKWILAHGQVSAQSYTITTSEGLPDKEQMGSWRVGYSCKVDRTGKVSECNRWSGGENDSRFYGNGLLAYLNVFGLILAEDPSDPARICKWLPGAYDFMIRDLEFGDINGFIWGKSSGQALAMAAEAAGAISTYCK